MLKKKKSYLVPIIGFCIISLIGAILLYLPISNNSKITFKDALYTAISGVTCTGLIKTVIANQFTFFGQLIIAILMEIGALGFVVFISYVWIAKGKKLQMSDIIMINDNISGDNYNSIKEYTILIFEIMLKVQICGSILLGIKFIPEFGILKGIWYSIFHTISAFANAGLDIIGENSLLTYKNDIFLQIVLIVLMILGSIGIFALEDLKKKKFKEFRLQTKIILTYTAILLIFPTFLFKIFEPQISLLNSLFMSSTARSTGFAVANLAEFSQVGKMLLIVLMFIGGSPASTAGGVRVVSIAIIVSTIIASLKGNEKTIIFWRTIPDHIVKKAFTLCMIFIIVLVSAIFVFAYFNNINILDITFETVSAVTNTGLSVINSDSINIIGDIILMLLMFIGRVGPISMILIFMNEDEEKKLVEYPTENLIL